MTDKFLIEGGKKIEGEIEVGGSKNAAGGVLAATLLTNEDCFIDNVPKVADVFTLLDILKGMGVEVEWMGERKVRIRAGKNVDPLKMDFSRVSKARLSVLLFGSLLPRFQSFKIASPGGDRIGLRPITTHLRALEELGAKIERIGDFYNVDIKKLEGKEIVLSEFSVTATENLLMAATLSQGETIIKGAACEPEILNLGEMLKKMGGKIEGLGTHQLKVQGVEKLGGVSVELIPDRLEAGTFLVIGALTPGELKIKSMRSEHLDLFLAKLKEINVNFQKEKDSIRVWFSPNLKPTKVQALPYPGFPTDLLPLVVPLLTQAEGKSLIHDPLYENRLNYTQELKKMGADIEIVDPHRAFVFGKTKLFGVKIESWDIRAGAALLVAGLMAEGRTTIENVEQIDRGYERIDERLQKLGAEIKRVNG